LLRALFELPVEVGCPPVAGAVWLQGDVLEDAPDGTGADGVHDAVGFGLARQVRAAPVGQV
jgi:hypothetical protein